MIKGLACILGGADVVLLCFFSLKKGRLRGDLITASRGAVEEEVLISLVISDRTQGNRMKQGRLRLDIWKGFFTLRVVGHWNRLPREVIMALSLSELLACLDNALRFQF